MRLRMLILLVIALALTACAGARSGRVPTSTPAPVKTQRPTFTATPTRQGATPAATRGVAAAPAPAQGPTATPVPPSPTPVPPSPTPVPPTATPEKASFTVSSPGVTNVRSGPGTNYPRIGEVRQGQTFEIIARNATGTWWQFDFNGQNGWISGELVSANAAAKGVPVATNIPPPPTAPPAPTRPPQPTSPPPAPPALFVQAGIESRDANNTNFDLVTFWGRLGKTGDYPISGGYRMRVSAPSGSREVLFGDAWHNAYPGLGAAEFRYNAKIELPRTSGGYRAVVVDGSGKEVGEVISGTLNERTHDVILSWWPR